MRASYDTVPIFPKRMNGFPWALLISTFVLGLAYFIKHFLANVIEEEHDFLMVIGVFLMIYIGAAIAITWLNPQISQVGAVLASNG